VAKRVALLQPDTILLVSPHTTIYSDYFHLSPGSGAKGSFATFSAPQIRIQVTYDVELRQQIIEEAQQEGLPAGTEGEQEAALDHGTMIPLYFIQQQWSRASVVRMGFSGGSSEQHAAFGRAISRAVNASGKRVLLVASGDLSHKLLASGPYGFQKEGPVFDQMVVDTIKQNRLADFLNYDTVTCRRAAECGLHSFQILAGCMEGLAVESELLSYEGPFGVGYAVAWIAIKEQLQDPYVRLARQAVEHYVQLGTELPLPKELPEA
jgi:AmmeMemoRadiSam system protein B